MAKQKRAQTKILRESVAVIGHGNWGTSLAYAIRRSSWTLREIVVREHPAAPRTRSTKPRHPWPHAALDAEILWLCVPDDAIEAACAELLRHRPSLRGQIVTHSSGARTASALQAARLAGARTAAVHPVMTFPTRRIVSLKNVLFGIESESPAARTRLKQLVTAIGGESFPIAAQNKVLYHAAGTLSSPLLVSALTAAEQTARLAGLAPAIAAKMTAVLAEASLANLRTQGPANSFSGPLARGDAGTIRLHLEALREHPVLAGVYRALAGHALESLPVRERETMAALLQPETKPARRKQHRK
ncbi:MAG: Rossmann-like and DUF2520 domain-containing protein [Acidobacteriaceae bacterium]